uniref:Uncharacterized protein n=1 Tax=Tanacetum cinerariifolium TaxID=118510 RepID=A0A6L2KCN8_TANCI|nr:hypothetical protein [Tanacetum cinerariifolium]
MMLAKAIARKKQEFINNNGLKEEFNATMVFMAKMKNVLSESDESSLSVNDTDKEEIFHDIVEFDHDYVANNLFDSKNDNNKSKSDRNIYKGNLM